MSSSFRPKSLDRPLLWAMAALAAILIFDLETPRGVVEGMFYSVPVVICLRSERRKTIWLVAIACTLFSLIGFWKEPAGIAWNVGLMNRLLAIFLVWLVTALCVGQRAAWDLHQDKRSKLAATDKAFRAQVLQRREVEISLESERRFLRHLLEAQETRRQSFSHEFDDRIVGNAVKALQRFEARMAAEPAAAVGQDSALSHLLRGVVDDCNRLADWVRPPLLDENGLVAALENLIEKRATPIPPVTLECEPSFERLPAGLEIAIFRAVQDALASANRDGRTDKIEIKLARTNDHVCLEIRDARLGCEKLQLPLNSGRTGGTA